MKEHFQDKHGEKQNLIDLETREGFTRITESQIKCAAGLNMHGERIKVIDKSNAHAFCPLCNAIKTWEHVLLCKRLRIREVIGLKSFNKKLNEAVNKVKVPTYEMNIVNKIIKDIRKYCNRESNFWTNQQALVMREVFRGVVIKSWVSLPLVRINFSVYNNILLRAEVELHIKCWRERRKALHSPEHEKKSLKKEIKKIKDNAVKGEIVNYKRHVNFHHINENTVSVEGMRSWIKKARQFRKNAKHLKQQDMRKFGVMR